jgi:hypothetical protein
VDKKKILFYGVGDATTPCPERTINIGEEVNYTNPACWQVIDTESGATIWTLASLAKHEPIERLNASFDNASISGGGRYLGMYSFYPADYKLYIIDLETGEVIFTSPLRVEESIWYSK